MSMIPSPVVVGQPSPLPLSNVYAKLSTLPEADHEVSSPAGYYPGLFESYENPRTYMERRRWFHTHSVSGSSDDDASRAIERLPRKNALNEYGHSEDREEYRRRREWYYHDIKSQKQSNVNLNHVEVHISDSKVDRADMQSWCTLCRVICVIVLALSVWFSANSYVTEITEDYNVSKQQANLLTVLVNVGFTVGATGSAIAQLPDRISPSRLLCIGCLGCASSSTLLATGLPFTILLIARFLNGMALALIYPILMRLTAGWFPPKQRGFALGVVIGGLTTGIALPNVLKAALPDTPWRWVVLGTSALALLAGALTFSLQDGPFASKVPGFSWANVWSVLRTPNWHFVTLSYCGHNVELFGGWAWMGAFIQSYLEDQAEHDSGSSTNASAIAFVIIALGSVGAVVGGRLADWMGKKPFILSMHLTSGTAISILPSIARNVESAAAVFVVAGLWGLTVIADSAQYSALLAEVMPDKRLLGTAITFSLALGFISTAVGIYVVPPLVEWGGWDGAFPILALGPGLGIICMCAVRPVKHAS